MVVLKERFDKNRMVKVRDVENRTEIEVSLPSLLSAL